MFNSDKVAKIEGILPSNTEMPNQVGGSDKEKCQVVILKSGRNFTFVNHKPNVEARSTSTFTIEISNSSSASNPLNFPLTNNASSLQNKKVPNKEVENTRQE
ncbi:hypothetical protein E5676_scaffold494G00460 [Cucumis melo var. makuwa]|uniref:Uncharacterized protein n=1 Tax=Cucumis melo var. makuwa TaxID=1194695 RepID=A0A5D3DEN2_CUCMM|nr:hypothetical protein E5676_scaffold494G00460 [Cucumis melo var. makuwa]